MEILKQLYSQICTLEDWLKRVDRNGWLANTLIQDTDSEQYKELLKSSIVAEKLGQEELPDISTFEQVSQQRELLLRVIQKLKRRNEKNVLTLGFTTASDNIGAQVSHINDLEYLYPNSCFNRLQYPVWCKLLSRIGDTAMEYLLTSTSMFIQAPNSSYIQLTGVPVFELWSLAPGTFHFKPQRCLKTAGAQKRKKKPRHNNDTNNKKSSKSVSAAPCIENSGNTGTASCKGSKRKKKNVVPEFSPYEYHTYINRIQMLYTKNLRERFHSNYILNLILPTEDGALTLYRHILEHKQIIFTKKANITWVFPEPSKDSICHDSSCCSVQNITQPTDPENAELDNHDSFFLSGHSTDKLLLEQRCQRSDKRCQRSDKRCQRSDRLTMESTSNAGRMENPCGTVIVAETTNKSDTQILGLQSSVNTDNPCENVIVAETTNKSNTQTLDLQNRENMAAGSFHSIKNSSSIFSSQGFESSGNSVSLNHSQQFETSGNESSYQNLNGIDSEEVNLTLKQTNLLSTKFDLSVFKSDSLGSDKNSNITSLTDEQSIRFTQIKDQNATLTSNSNICMLDAQFSSTPIDDCTSLTNVDTSTSERSNRLQGKSRKRKCDGCISYPENKRPCLSIDSPNLKTISCQNEDTMMEVDTDEGTIPGKCVSNNVHGEYDSYFEPNNSETVIVNEPNTDTVISKRTVKSDKPSSETVILDRSSIEIDVADRPSTETVVLDRPSKEMVKSDRQNTTTVILDRPKQEMVKSDRQNTTTAILDRPSKEMVKSDRQNTTTVILDRPSKGTDISDKRKLDTVIEGNTFTSVKNTTCLHGREFTEPEKMIEDSSSTGNKNDGQMNEVVIVNIEFMTTFQCLLQRMLVKHRKCPYQYLLDYYCPAQRPQKKCQVYKRGHKYFGDVKLTRSNSIRENLHNFVPYRQVYLFVRRVCLFVIPEELWGTRANRNRFLYNIKRIISFNKFDKFCIGQLMSGVQVKSIIWLRVVKSNSVRQHITAKLWHWLVEEFAIHVIKTYFYITDTTQHGNRLFYYRKKTWQWLHIKDLMKRNIMKIIPESTVRKLMTERKTLGVGCLRFFPKSKGLRPIINLSKQQYLIGQSSIPINKQLLNLLQVLYLIKKNNPKIIGAAKFGLDEVYKVWKEFSVRQSCPLYFVKTDISSCFDEILQHKLFSVIRNIFANSERVDDEYLIRRYVKIVKEGGIIKRKFIRKACQLGDFRTDFVLFIKQQSQEESFHNVIFVDQVVTQQETREQLLKQLHSHIFHNIIKIGQSYYQQSKGISQGSVISTLLCNIYYGEMERRFPVEEGELMMRIVDDALFVTKSKERAVTYCQQMITGLPDFNFSINHNKVLTNFKCDVPGLEDIPVLENTDWLLWCGILLNMKTLEASVNLSFYFNCFLEDSMTFDTSCKPGATVKRKLFRSLRLKCHPLYLDSQLNSMNVVIINIYKMFLLSAFKFSQYIKHLSRKDNYSFLINLIKELGHYFYLIYTEILKHKVQGKTKELNRVQIQWLCTHAYIIKLNEHRSMYKPVVSVLQQYRKNLTKKIQGPLTACYMETICGHKLLEDFRRIR